MKVIVADMPAYGEMNKDLNRLAAAYEENDVQVIRYPVPPELVTADSAFVRDVFGYTPLQLIRPQLMGKESRRWESDAFFNWYLPGDEGRHWYYHLPEGFFEGADLLWTTLRHVIIGEGSRTNEAATKHIIRWLEHKDAHGTNTVLTMPDWHPQHLLGLINCVWGDEMYVDERVWDECGDEKPECLDGAVVLPHDEYHQKHTNFVQYQDKIFINAGASKTIAILESRGLTVIPVEIPALLAEGGGVACSTGILRL